MREPVFFVWQCREAPKDWPWLTKNQRWVPRCNHSAALFYYARSWSFFWYKQTFPRAYCLKVKAHLFFFNRQLHNVTLPYRKACERASTGAHLAPFACLTTHAKQPAGVILGPRLFAMRQRVVVVCTEKSPAHQLAQVEKSFCTCAVGVNSW